MPSTISAQRENSRSTNQIIKCVLELTRQQGNDLLCRRLLPDQRFSSRALFGDFPTIVFGERPATALRVAQIQPACEFVALTHYALYLRTARVACMWHSLFV